MKTAYVVSKQGNVIETNNIELWPGAERLTAKQGKERLKAAAVKELKELLKNPCPIYTVLRHCSASGMLREISLHIVAENRLISISYYASKAIDQSFGRHNGLVIKGCGMDMGFALVDDLLSIVYPGLDWQTAGYRQEWI